MGKAKKNKAQWKSERPNNNGASQVLTTEEKPTNKVR